jgi:hypothetical protein
LPRQTKRTETFFAGDEEDEEDDGSAIVKGLVLVFVEVVCG